MLAPPLFPQIPLVERTGYKIGKSFGLVGIIILLLAFGFFIYEIVPRQTRARLSYNSPVLFVDPEHGNPANFLAASGTYRRNLWGTKWILYGTVFNNATHTNYKDVRIRVDLFSNTHTVNGSKEYIVYDYFPYGLKKEVTIEVDKPAVAAICGIVAIEATVY